MSDVQCTPGPWRACHEGDCKCGMIWAADGNTLVAVAQGPAFLNDSVGPDCVPDDEAQKANAKLIAAAPTMQATIDALTAQVQKLERQVGQMALLETDNERLVQQVAQLTVERDEALGEVYELREHRDEILVQLAEAVVECDSLRAQLEAQEASK